MVQIALDSKIEAKLVLEDPDIEEMKLEFLTQIHVRIHVYVFLFSYFFKVSVKNIIPNITL